MAPPRDGTPLLVATLTCAMLCGAAMADSGWRIVANGKADAASKTTRVAQASRAGEGDTIWSAWWADFKASCNKTYANTGKESQAFKNFQANMANVAAINANTTISYWASGNCLFDYTFAEIQAMLLTLKAPTTNTSTQGRRLTEDDLMVNGRHLLQANTVDHRTKGTVTPVRDQGGCGCCWAFAATAAIESAYLISKGLTVSSMPNLDLSEQQLVSCAIASGCGGGGSDAAIMYNAQSGQTTESNWPYTQSNGVCTSGLASSLLSSGQAAQLTTYASYVPTFNELALMQRVAIQPTVFYFDVVGDFYSYAGGVYNPSNCAGTVNHAMLVVGYVWTGSSSGSYWIIKNSWGTGWGQSGYAYLAMTGQNSAGPCNMYTFMVYPPLSFSVSLSGTPSATSSPPPSPAVRSPPPSPKSVVRSPAPPRPPPRPAFRG